jgi:hypothetical protein
MRFATVCLALGLVAVGQSASQDTAEKPRLPPGKPGEQIAKLIKQYEDAVNALQKRFEAAKDEKEEEALEKLMPKTEDYAQLLLRIAEDNPKDDMAIEAHLWIAKNARPSLKNGSYARSKAILVRDYLNHPKIGPFCRLLRSDWTNPESLAILRSILENNPAKGAQAHAAFYLAGVLNTRAGLAVLLKTNQLHPKQIEGYGKETVAQFRKENVQALKKEAESLLERITKDKDYASTLISYGDGKKKKLGELATRELFEQRHLQPGQKAPEIAGEDIDGKTMKLSDFHGRVVFLEFWATW